MLWVGAIKMQIGASNEGTAQLVDVILPIHVRTWADNCSADVVSPAWPELQTQFVHDTQHHCHACNDTNRTHKSIVTPRILTDQTNKILQAMSSEAEK
jgi:hypothetical protein